MAIVTAIKAKTQSKTAMGKVIAYCVQDAKTRYHDPETGQSYRLITGQNCVAETAMQEFMATKLQHDKDHGVFYKHFVQSFKPDSVKSPKEILQMGLELAEYFKGFEVLVATHIDADHWHSHLIVNSVNAETGLKIQFNEKSLNELRRKSDEICRAHGLEPLKTYQKESPAAGMNTREYRAAVRGDSWKFKLMSAIDQAMEVSGTKGEFIANMERMGYGVKWIEHYKYITYTTPEGQKCRDNKLHESKYLKERMEHHYEISSIEREKSAGQSADETRKSARGIHAESADVRNSPGRIQYAGGDDDRNRQAASAHAGQNQGITDMDGLETGYSAGSRTGNEQPRKSRSVLRKQPVTEISEPTGNGDGSAERQNFRVGTDAPSAGQYAEKATVAMDGNRRGVGADIAGLAAALENLVLVNQPKEEQPKQIVERKNRQKKKQKQSHDWEIYM